MADEVKMLKVRVAGKVQGVGFRLWTMHQAEQLGLDGYVRNEIDGSVSAVLSGGDQALATMLERLWDGPPGSSVSNVAYEEETGADRPSGFRITR